MTGETPKPPAAVRTEVDYFVQEHLQGIASQTARLSPDEDSADGELLDEIAAGLRGLAKALERRIAWRDEA
jgi:hypothetical protein